ncbi:ROK family protein [Sinorhizobium medicae]|uniref:Sugar kinase of the NBD/HSP70 family, may contain an N-terminal HTH domain n=1 Tax=Sinorhizobium medicae TaxID=110321 RepID=A0A508X7K3_9HYPH|nr:ROK family protein [Sinorhizobium medicae]VTZ65822.1 Sugar kinase of the NBD/HSP70 family, may contain an N-terminal HTH domain [Sinorhizobium medicae]
MTPTTIAFDLGGTKIDICRMTKFGEILWRQSVATSDLEPGDPSFLDRAFALFAEHVCEGDDKIGLSWNAPVHEGRLTQSSLLGGRINVDLAQRLKQAFSCDVQVESDVHAMVLGEYRFGIGAAAAPILLINLGSGAGIGYHDGRLMRGNTGGAGLVCLEKRYIPEIGESLILDQLLSGRGVARVHEKLTGATLAAAEVASRASQGDDAALETFAIIARQFGAYLVTLSRLFNPRSIVLAGSVSRAAPLFLDAAKDILEREVEPACRPELVTVSALAAPACVGLA